MEYWIRIVSNATALGLALALLMPGGPPAASARTVKRVVHDPLDTSPCPGKTDDTIMAAVAAVGLNPGTITVCPGTYAERVATLGLNNVKLVGRPGAKIIPPASPSPYTGAIVLVEDAQKVTVQGFIIDGAGRFSDSSDNVGIMYLYAGGTVSNNYISNIHSSPASSATAGTGIRVISARGSMKIFKNTVYDFGGVGIEVAASPKATVQKNLLWSTVAFGAHPTGIDFATSDGGSITSNSITSDWRPGLLIYPHGIRLTESSYVKVSGNQISHLSGGISVISSHVQQDADNLTISANRINDAGTGIRILVWCKAGDSTASPSSDNNKITGNTLYAPTFAGNSSIWLDTLDDDDTDAIIPSLTNTTISGNKQYGFPLFGGRIVLDESGGVTLYSASNKTIPPPTGY